MNLLLPETPVTAELTEATVLSARSAGVFVRTHSTTIRLMTDSSGRFSVDSLTPGKWRVTAKLTTTSLETVYDSGGALDWIVNAVVPINGLGVGDFAAAGNTSILNSPVPPGTTEVNVKWEGVDKKFNTDDDVRFTLKVSDGKVQAEESPVGPAEVRPGEHFGVESATLLRLNRARISW